jgi:hypothetical protein
MASNLNAKTPSAQAKVAPYSMSYRHLKSNSGVSRTRAKFHWGPHPRAELCAQFPGVSDVVGGGLVFLLPNRGSRAAKLTTEVLQNLSYGSIKTDVGFRYAASHRLLTVAD